jgi:tripartite-type tricarboxylate transporter receptor subunit TctC
MRVARFIAALIGCIFVSTLAAADKYPSRPIKMVIGFLAGGPTDTTGRIYCEWLTQHIGAACVVENKVGQGGMIAAASVVNSPPDGYTVLFVGPNNAIGQTLYKSLSFDHMRDTVPVAGLARLSNIMVVPPSLPVKTVAEFIAYAKANPGKLSYASSGNGTSVHMSADFKMMTKLDMVHVPYKGSAAVYPDLLTGKVDVLFDNLPGALEFVKTGKLRALGVTTAQRQNVLPEVPTVGETVPGYEASVFYGIAAPKGTPPEIVAVLNKSINDAQKDPVILKRLKDLGSDPLPMAPAEFGKFTGAEIEKWAKVVRAAKLSID